MNWNFFEDNSLQSVVVNWILKILEFKRPAYLDRVSLKIQIAIATIDIIRHLNYIYGSNLGETFCEISAFLYAFCFHANTFLNTAIALNLQIIYLHEWIPFHLGFYLYIIPILFATVIDLVPFAMNAYGRSYGGFCFLKLNVKNREWIKIFLLYTTNLPLLIYCFIIPIMLMLKLFLTRYNYENIRDSETRPLLSPIRNPLSRTLGFRVSLYPLACFLCHIGAMCFNISISFDYDNSVLGSWGLFGLSVYGTVNLLCFLLDPYIQESWNPPQLLIDEQSNTNFEHVTEESSSNPVIIPSNQQASSTGLSNMYGNSSQELLAKSKTLGKPKKSARFALDLNRYYIAPIPIPGARSPDEYRREVWHTTDRYLDIKK